MRRLSLCTVVLSSLASAVVAQSAAQEASAQLVADLAPRLREHPFFGRIAFLAPDGSHAPFVFYLQRPLHDDQDYARKVINSYLTFLGELSRVFAREYGPPPAGAAPDRAYAIAILASRGIYDDYARSVADRGLHFTRAHYNPELRLAITHQVLFGTPDPRDERQSLLHEFVHALQHSYSTTGKMTRPVWFNEGLAEYRSACTHVASSLRDPPLHDEHVKAMAFGYAHPLGRAHVLPLAELVVPESYPQVVETVKKRGAVKAELVLPMFYSQSEMTVRFLHEFGQGKYRAGFQRYFQAVEAGAAGLQAFQDAFEARTPQAMAAIEQDWLSWLNGVLQQRFPGIGDLASGNPGSARVPLPPPAGFDRTTLAWQPEDKEQRLAAVRRLCALGRYEEALAALPEQLDLLDAQKGPLHRERDRVQALLTLRETVIADLDKRKAVFQLDTATGAVRPKFMERKEDGALVKDGSAQRLVPWTEFGPSVLLRQGKMLRQFEGESSALQAFLVWLSGRPRSHRDLKELLAKGYPSMVDLRADLTTDLDGDQGTAAVGLIDLQQLPVPDEPGAARKSLQEFEQIIRRHREHPLLQQRKVAIEQLARALGERAFALDDAAAMGVHAQVEQLDDGRVRLHYTDPPAAPSLDFAPATDEDLQMFTATRIAYDGPTAVTAGHGHWQLIGAGFLRWATPLAGPQEVELEFEVAGGQGNFGLFLCREKGRHLAIWPDGQVSIWDESTRIDDQVGKPSPLYIDQLHRLRIVHDGKKQLQTWLDKALNATLPSVGNCLRGDLLLLVRSSEPIKIKRLSITGRLDPTDPQPLRERSVQELLGRLWR